MFPCCNIVAKGVLLTYFCCVKKCRKPFSKLLAAAKLTGATLLVGLYAIGSLPVSSFHELFHAHSSTALHTQEQEANDCHRLVYHGLTTGDCKHNAHLTESTHCPWCQTVVQPLQLATERWSGVSIVADSTHHFIEQPFHGRLPNYCLPPRAPPTIA